MVKAKSYKEHLLKQLQKPKEAAAYLDAALQDKDYPALLLALQDTAEATDKTQHGPRLRPL
jgi:hypothetical protein